MSISDNLLQKDVCTLFSLIETLFVATINTIDLGNHFQLKLQDSLRLLGVENLHELNLRKMIYDFQTQSFL